MPDYLCDEPGRNLAICWHVDNVNDFILACQIKLFIANSLGMATDIRPVLGVSVAW